MSAASVAFRHVQIEAEIDAEIRSFVEEGYAKAEKILSEHMDQLHKVAQYLIANEKIDGPEFERLMKGEDAAAAEAEPEIVETKPAQDSAMDAYAQDLREREDAPAEDAQGQTVQDLTEE